MAICHQRGKLAALPLAMLLELPLAMHLELLESFDHAKLLMCRVQDGCDARLLVPESALGAEPACAAS